MKHLSGERVVLATHNPGKLVEFQAAFAGDDIDLVSAGALGLPEPDETGTTFTENALIKARASAAASGLPALADDSGLAVTALDGAPGVYSARWAGPSKDFAIAMDRIRTEIVANGSDDWRAAFICVLAVALPSGETFSAAGRVDGQLVYPIRGEGGFGYDPAFAPDGEDRTFGEMSRDEKAVFSHRMRALAALRDVLAG